MIDVVASDVHAVIVNCNSADSAREADQGACIDIIDRIALFCRFHGDILHVRMACENKLHARIREDRRGLFKVAEHIAAAEKRINRGGGKDRMMRHGEHLIPRLVRLLYLVENPVEMILIIAAEFTPVPIVVQSKQPPAGGKLHDIGMRLLIDGDRLIQAEIAVKIHQFLTRGRRDGKLLVADVADGIVVIVVRRGD